MEKLKNVKGIIFDLDGTLLHSYLDFKWLRQQLDCPQDVDLLTHIESMNEDAKQRAVEIVKQHEIEDAEKAVWIDGADEFVDKLVASGMPTAIVTRNCREATQIKLSNNRVPINTVITREDGPAKPDPTTLIGLGEKWQIPSSDLVYIGDYLYDIQAAMRADMIACLFAPGGVPDYAHLADVVFSDYKELANIL